MSNNSVRRIYTRIGVAISAMITLLAVLGLSGATPSAQADGCVIQGTGTPCTLTPAPPAGGPAQWTGFGVYGPNVAWQLFQNYESASGADAVVDWGYMMGDPGFELLLEGGSIPVGQSVQFAAPAGDDLYFAMGTFTVTRDSQNCYETYDLYDFDHASWYSPLADQADSGQAATFNVHSSGCL